MDPERQKRPPQLSDLLCERSWDLTELIFVGTHGALWALAQTHIVGRRWLRASRKKGLKRMLQRNIYWAAFETEGGKEYNVSWMMWESVGLNEDNLWHKGKKIVQHCGRRVVQWGECRGESVWWMGIVACRDNLCFSPPCLERTVASRAQAAGPDTKATNWPLQKGGTHGPPRKAGKGH